MQVVSTVRIEPDKGFISMESPLGRALLGHRVGETVSVHVNADYSYDAAIRAIEPDSDDGSAPLMPY